MNEFTTKAFSIIFRNEEIFEFTQEHGLHGVAICNKEDSDENWFNPKLAHSLGYKEAQTLTWKKIISPSNLEKIEKVLDPNNYAGNILSNEISFLHAKGFLIPMIFKSICIEGTVVIAVKKVYDYSHIEYNPELDFQREQLLETVLDTVNVGIIACDNKGKLNLFNKTAKKWHGLPATDIPQTEFASYYNLYHPDGKTLFRTEELGLIDMLQNGTIRYPEMLLKPENERDRFIVASGARLYDGEKNVSGAVIALHNITDWKEAEEKLRISEETFRGSFKSAADGMAITDDTGTCIEVNDRLCEIMGYTASELKTLNFQEVTYPEDLEEDLRLWTELLKGERDFYQMEKRAIQKSGKIKHIIVSVAIVRDENKDPFHFITQIKDISFLKEAEEKLRISEETFRGTFENAADGMSITDIEGNFTAVNESLWRMLGYSENELKKLNFLEVTHPEDIADDRKDLMKLLSGENISLQKEKRFLHKNGESIPILLSVSVIKNRDNKPHELIGQITDISALKIAEKELKEVLDLSTDQNQRLRNFAHIVSHNLRSHSGNFEMLLDIFKDEQPHLRDNEVVEMLFKSSGNLKETIAHLNEVAMINTSVSENIHSLNLRNYVDKALRSINVIIQKSGLIVHNNISEEYNVFALPAYLESIILNFSTNAVKYRSSERQPFLKFSARKTKEYLELQIEDNGIGIDLQKHGHKLFGMYKTFHSHEDARGIGLFITKNQIEAIGGKVEVQSKVGKGSIFTIFFKYEKS